MTDENSNDQTWGAAKSDARERNRKRWQTAAIGAALTAPLIIPALTGLYHGLVGVDRAVAPGWLMAASWLAALALAGSGLVVLFRTSDEFEGQSMMNAFAISGLLLLFLVPPAVFLSGYFGLGSGDAVLLAWFVSLVAGIAAFRFRWSWRRK